MYHLQRNFVSKPGKLRAAYTENIIFNGYSHLAVADVTQCFADDSECLRGTITDVIRGHPNGLSGLNIPPLDPLRINSIDISQGAHSPIAINLKLRDQQLFGISQGQIIRAE